MTQDPSSDLVFLNPFEQHNAIDMDDESILDYWCDPHKILDKDTADFFREKTLFFEGGRGCGKTMLLKYLSFEVQKLEAQKKKELFLDHLTKQGAVAFYIRIDNATLTSFQDLNVKSSFGDRLFTHYLELSVCQWYISFLSFMKDRHELGDRGWQRILEGFGKLLGTKFADFQSLKEHIAREISKVNSFRRDIAFNKVVFRPKQALGIGDLSVHGAELICSVFTKLRKTRLLVAIDEYENFSENQQRLVNSLIRSSGRNIGFRLGMRNEGLKTGATVQPEEFIKENHDYRVVRFKDILVKESSYREFLVNLAKKRLQSTAVFRDSGMIDIREILGDEDDVSEAIDIVNSKGGTHSHFSLLAGVIPAERLDYVVKQISHSQNPLLEMLNILYVRRKKDPRQIREEMLSFLNESHTKKGRRAMVTKYHRDYVDKYKLSLLFLLANQYRVDKKYYGFNIFCYLSSGIVRNFINLCKTSFRKARFEIGLDQLLRTKTIPKEIQHQAAMNEAQVEEREIDKIPTYSVEIRNLARNLGMIFFQYHKDQKVRYPETNTFSVGDLNGKNRDILRSAIRWSIIQPKGHLQKTAPGGRLGKVYTLNRLMCPLYHISYRTRGGVIEPIDDSTFSKLCMPEEVKPYFLSREMKAKDESLLQMKLDSAIQ